MQNNGKNDLGQFLKQLRTQKGVSLAEMERKTGLSGSYINRIENKSRDNPSLDSISRLVRFFDIPFSSLAEFCECGNKEGQVKNLDYILMNERYLFANIEADIELKMIVRELIKELESYCIKALTSRQDENKILDLAILLRERLLSV
jgi:transcriptional regulator with XRE-family HTH domain